MYKLSANVTDDAVSGLMALRGVLSQHLSSIENQIQQDEDGLQSNDALCQDSTALQEIREVRTAVLSGLASINELLGWVRLLAVTDLQGNERDCVMQLPKLTAPTLI